MPGAGAAFTGVGLGPLEAEIGVVTGVGERDGVPVCLYDVRTRSGRELRNVPALLPFSSHAYQDPSKSDSRSPRAAGGEGIVAIANKGDSCLIMMLPGKSAHRQAYVLGFFAPLSEKTGATTQNKKRIRPGSMRLASPYGNGVTILAGGGIEIEADSACATIMTPLTADAAQEGEPDGSDRLQAMIAHLCRNFVLQTAGGEVTFGEAGGGKTALRMRVNELSRWTDPVRRKSSGARFVEIQYGASDSGALMRMLAHGKSEEVVLADDGDGGWTLKAARNTETVAEVVVITSDSQGRTVKTPQATYEVEGRVSWTCSQFSVEASRTDITGQVLLNGGGRPGARVGDVVDLDTGIIVTGDPRLLH